MFSARRLVEALEREGDQLSEEFIQQPALRKRLMKAGCNLVFNLEGATQVATIALNDRREKKDYSMDNHDDEVLTPETGELTPPLTDPESGGIGEGEVQPEYKTWVDDNGKVCYEIQEVEIAFWGPPLRSMYVDLLVAHTAG